MESRSVETTSIYFIRLLKISILSVVITMTTFSVCSAAISKPSTAEFPPNQSYPLNDSTPSKVVIADFNNDTLLDIAVLNIASVDVLLNDPNAPGTYGIAINLGLPGNMAAMSFAISDIDGDKILDLLVSLQDTTAPPPQQPTDSVGVYSGQGDGTFQEIAMLTGVVKPDGIVAADFDNTDANGIADFAVTNNAGDMGAGVNIAADNGNGGFTDIVLFVTRQGPTDPDTGKPSLTFMTSKIMVGGNTGNLYSADMNGDSLPDLVTDSGIYINDGTGGFSQPTDLAGNRGVAIGRLDRDGLLDIAQLKVNQNKVSDIIIQTMRANGSLQQLQTITTTNASYTAIAINDLNLDGLGDIIAFDNNDKSVKIFLQYCNGTFPTTPISLNNASASSAVASALLDDDAYPDIVALIDNKAGNNARASVWLQAPPAQQAGTLQICVDQISESESIGIVEVDVNRVNGSQGAVTANYTAAGFGTLAPAMVGEDFNDVSGTVGSVTFLDGETGPKRIQFQIIDDVLVELVETFVVTLESVDNPLVTLNVPFLDSYVNILDNEINIPPVANPGTNQTVDAQTVVSLDGSASSDAEGAISMYRWEQILPLDVPVSLRGAGTSVATFTAPNVSNAQTPLLLNFKLTVTDSGGVSDSAAVQITVNRRAILAPIADAGLAQSVVEGATISLDGSGSSGNIVTYAWQQTAGPTVMLSDVSVPAPTFVAPAVTTDTVLSFELTVTDNAATTATAAVDITIQPAPVVVVNMPPIADAGPDSSGESGANIELNGQASSDPENDTLIYKWQQVSGPGVNIKNPSAVIASFTAPTVAIDTNLVFSLTVTDIANNSDVASVKMTVMHQSSIANASVKKIVASGASVNLKVANASGPGVEGFTYYWQQLSGTEVILATANTKEATFTAPMLNTAETLRFELSITDTSGNKKTDIVDVLVLGQSEQSFIVSADVIHVNGNAGSVLVSVDRIGDAAVAMSVPYSTKDVTAYAGVNYIAATGVIEFLPGDRSKTIEISIINVDSLDDLDQFFRFEISIPDGVIVNKQTVSKIVIHEHTKTDLGLDNSTQNGNGSAAEKTKLGAFDPLMLSFFVLLIVVRQNRRLFISRFSC